MKKGNDIEFTFNSVPTENIDVEMNVRKLEFAEICAIIIIIDCKCCSLATSHTLYFVQKNR